MKLCSKVVVGLLLLATTPSCGGKSAVESGQQAPSGGSSAHEGGAANVAGASSGGAASAGAPNGGTSNGGTSNGGTSSGGAAPLSTTCPVLIPAPGSACQYVGNPCNYTLESCGSVTFACTTDVWVEQPRTDGQSLTCANFTENQLGIPNDGDPCTCQGMLDCTFAACDTKGNVHAVCDNTKWQVTATPCSDSPCGTSGLRCKTGEACVVRAGGISADYRCVADPCTEQGSALSCDCGSSVCISPSERCVLENGLIDCVCDTC